MIKIYELIWDEWNVNHIKKHNVMVGEVEDVAQGIYKQQLTYHKRYLIFGKTPKGRLLTIVLAKENKDKYYVVTARDMSKKKEEIYKMKTKKLPKFKTIKEEAEFWDTHDVTNYLDEMKNVDIEFKPRQPKKTTIIVRVQLGLKKRLEKIAEHEGLPLSTLIRRWFIEKVKKPK